MKLILILLFIIVILYLVKKKNSKKEYFKYIPDSNNNKDLKLNLENCCLVSKEYDKDKKTPVYKYYQLNICNAHDIESSNDRELKIHKLNKHDFKSCNKEKSNLGTCKNDNNECKEFITKETCDKHGMNWNNVDTCFNDYNKIKDMKGYKLKDVLNVTDLQELELKKCCLVSKELDRDKKTFVYKYKKLDNCNLSDLNSSNNKEINFEKKCGKLGTCRNYNNECKEFMTKEECDKFGMTWDDKTTCFDKHNKTEKGKNDLITFDPYKVIYIPDRDYDMVKTNDSYCTCKEYEKSNCGKDIKPICH